MTFTVAMEHMAQGFEPIGAIVLLGGLFFCAGLAIRSHPPWRTSRSSASSW
jgi:hypothetical protein